MIILYFAFMEIILLMSLKLHKCTAQDLPLIRELSIKTYRQTFTDITTQRNMEDFLSYAFDSDRLAAELAAEQSDFYLLYCDDQEAGYIKVNNYPCQSDVNDPKSLEIQRIYIDQDFQGKGLGSFLMREAINIAKSLRKEYVWLGVWEHNYKAQSFYSKHGFYRIGAHPFIMGDDEQTDYILRKDLA